MYLILRRPRLPSLFLFGLLLYSVSSVAAQAATTAITEKRIMGWVENVYLPPTYTKLKAKLDTGAKTSSIDAHNIQSFQKDNETWVRFTVKREGREAYTDKNGRFHKEKPAVDITLERELVRVAKIKRHKRDSMKRYVINLPIFIGGRHHTAEFTLTDRRKFIYPVLLGRRFLRDIAIVDPSKTFLVSQPPSPEWIKPATLPLPTAVTKPSQSDKNKTGERSSN